MHTPNPVLTEQFARICRFLHMSLHHKRQRHGPAADPHRGQGRVLALLKMQPEISQKELSFLLDIRPQSLGELLAKLEKSGFVERTQSETDNRVLNIRLTKEGKTAARDMTKEEPEFFGDLTSEEQTILSGYLDRVIAGFEEKFGDMPPHGHGPHHHRHDCAADEGEEHPHRGGCPMRGHGGHGRHGRHDGPDERGCGHAPHGRHRPGGRCRRDDEDDACDV